MKNESDKAITPKTPKNLAKPRTDYEAGGEVHVFENLHGDAQLKCLRIFTSISTSFSPTNAKPKYVQYNRLFSMSRTLFKGEALQSLEAITHPPPKHNFPNNNSMITKK